MLLTAEPSLQSLSAVFIFCVLYLLINFYFALRFGGNVSVAQPGLELVAVFLLSFPRSGITGVSHAQPCAASW